MEKKKKKKKKKKIYQIVIPEYCMFNIKKRPKYSLANELNDNSSTFHILSFCSVNRM